MIVTDTIFKDDLQSINYDTSGTIQLLPSEALPVGLETAWIGSEWTFLPSPPTPSALPLYSPPLLKAHFHPRLPSGASPSVEIQHNCLRSEATGLEMNNRRQG